MSSTGTHSQTLTNEPGTSNNEASGVQQPNVYQRTLLNTLLAQQAQLAAAQGPRLPIQQTQTVVNNGLPTESSVPGLVQPSWYDPQVHIATATSKSTAAFYDICDFVPKAVEEEVVIGGSR